MRITLLQRDIVWADPEANMRRNDALFQSDGGADLYVFPEMFSTGFCTRPEGIAEESPSATLEWMKQKAANFGCAVAGSVAVHERGNYFNRFYFVTPDRKAVQYDQAPPVHLRRRAPHLHARQRARNHHIQGCAHTAAHMLRPALPRMVAQQG